MCTDAFHIRRIEGLRKVLLAAEDYAFDTTKDTEGCTDVRAAMIDEVSPLSQHLIILIRQSISMIQDDNEKKKQDEEMITQLASQVIRALGHAETKGLRLHTNDPSMN